jgi:cysteinyl-tRNA synthetase
MVKGAASTGPAATKARRRTATRLADCDYTAALANDLNTAEARAAIFELVRAGNSAADAGTLGAENATQILRVLKRSSTGVFAVLEDRDAEITRAALAWAEREGRLDEAAPNSRQISLSDAEIDALVAERTQAKKTRNFARADAIRNDLARQGNPPRRFQRWRPLEEKITSALEKINSFEKHTALGSAKK